MPTTTSSGRSRKIGSVDMMDRNLIRAAALFILLFLSALAATGVQANTCIEPVKISGILCGRVFDPSGAPVPDVELRLLDEAGSVAAEVRADSKGNFASFLVASRQVPADHHDSRTDHLLWGNRNLGQQRSNSQATRRRDSGVNVGSGRGKPKRAGSLIGRRFSLRPRRTGC